MCTLTYVPLGADSFIFTTNRDEGLTRLPANPPRILETRYGNILAPVDGNAGGTWVASSDLGKTVCLLNGAFEPHAHVPPYRKSRGLVVLDVFNYSTFADFLKAYDLNGIEPFTMVSIETTNNLVIQELIWDGEKKYTRIVDATQPALWASVTLYTPEIVEKRKQWLADWLQNHGEINQTDMLKFHSTAGDGDPENNLVMRRGNFLATVSITSILKKADNYKMIYKDLLADKEYRNELPLG